MNDEFVASDAAIFDLLRSRDALTVNELARSLSVTATAVRQRLARLMGQGYVERTSRKAGRGRPSHCYTLTAVGRRHAGANFGDLAVALWQEVRAVADVEVRRGLLKRISGRLAGLYRERVTGSELSEKMASVARLFAERRVPFEVDRAGGLPVLKALACPYPELAETDPSICAMERLMMSDLLGTNMRLSQCRLDGAACCTFAPESPAVAAGVAGGVATP